MDDTTYTHANRHLNAIARALDALEGLEGYDDGTPELVDLAGRLNVLGKRIETIVSEAKDTIKAGIAPGEDTRVLGERFLLFVQHLIVPRFDVKGFAEAHPKLHSQWVQETTQVRATFKARS